MDKTLWRVWREKLELFDDFGRKHFAVEEREGARLKARFFRFCAPRGVVLDLGCGTGFNRRFLPSETRYVGIDPLQLVPGYSFPFARAMGEFLPFTGGVFDCVICIATLDHVADPERIFRECHRVLRPQGVLGIVSKVEVEGGAAARGMLYLRVGLRKLLHGNFSGLARGLREVLTGSEDEFHMHHFTETSLRSLCGDCFGDIATETIGNVIFLRGRKLPQPSDAPMRAASAGEDRIEPCAG